MCRLWQRGAVVVLVLAMLVFASHPAAAERPQVGLALSGGAALGLAHIGVIAVLEEHGIPVDIVTGTSAGAMLGALYATGVPIETIESAALGLGWTDLASTPALLQLGFFNTGGLERFLTDNSVAEDFSDLQRQLAVVATDLVTGQRVVLDRGSVARAAAASAAIPVLFIPVEHEGQLLVDGGLADNLPDQLARDLGADLVIAVDISSDFRFSEVPEGKTEVGLRAYNIMMMYHSPPTAADIVVRPQLGGLSGMDLEGASEIIARGRQAAEAIIPDIVALFEELKRASDKGGL